MYTLSISLITGFLLQAIGKDQGEYYDNNLLSLDQVKIAFDCIGKTIQSAKLGRSQPRFELRKSLQIKADRVIS